jgi:hypothetical protein
MNTPNITLKFKTIHLFYTFKSNYHKYSGMQNGLFPACQSCGYHAINISDTSLYLICLICPLINNCLPFN